MASHTRLWRVPLTGLRTSYLVKQMFIANESYQLSCQVFRHRSLVYPTFKMQYLVTPLAISFDAVVISSVCTNFPSNIRRSCRGLLSGDSQVHSERSTAMLFSQAAICRQFGVRHAHIGLVSLHHLSFAQRCQLGRRRSI